MSETEKTFLKKGSLVITSRRAVIDGESFPIQDLKSAALNAQKPGITVGVILAVVTAALSFVTAQIAIKAFTQESENEGDFYGAVIVILLIGAAAFASALATFNTFRNREETYQILLTPRGAKTICAAESADRQHVERIVEAINAAIQEQRAQASG